jgi:hypothetical protein
MAGGRLQVAVHKFFCNLQPERATCYKYVNTDKIRMDGFMNKNTIAYPSSIIFSWHLRYWGGQDLTAW